MRAKCGDCCLAPEKVLVSVRSSQSSENSASRAGTIFLINSSSAAFVEAVSHEDLERHELQLFRHPSLF
jgi:hypothetical protein